MEREVFCRNHPERVAETLCERCGDYICGLCAVTLDRDPDGFASSGAHQYCPVCASRVRADLLPLGPYVPWEHRSRLGTARAAFETVQAAFSRPQEFATRLPLTGGIGDPMLFGMLIRGIVVVAYGLMAVAFVTIIALAARTPQMLIQIPAQAISIPINVLWAAVLLVVMAGFLHLGVLVAGGTRGFEATFRVYAYSHAVDVLDLVPVLGPLLSLGFRIALAYFGFKNAHDLPPLRALLVAVSPIALALFFSALLVGLIVVMVLLVSP